VININCQFPGTNFYPLSSSSVSLVLYIFYTLPSANSKDHHQTHLKRPKVTALRAARCNVLHSKRTRAAY